MPKYFCINDSCEHHGSLIDIDSMLLAYYHNFEHKDFMMKSKKFYCNTCGQELDLVPVNISNSAHISKWGLMSWEEKKTMLKKRSQDMSIPYNRESRDRKEAFEQKQFKQVK
jgi:hypothetical protein